MTRPTDKTYEGVTFNSTLTKDYAETILQFEINRFKAWLELRFSSPLQLRSVV